MALMSHCIILSVQSWLKMKDKTGVSEIHLPPLFVALSKAKWVGRSLWVKDRMQKDKSTGEYPLAIL